MTEAFEAWISGGQFTHPTKVRIEPLRPIKDSIDSTQTQDTREPVGASEDGRVSAQDPLIILAGIKKFGLAPDGADLRDLEAAIKRIVPTPPVGEGTGGHKIIEGLEDALAYVRGDKSKGRETVYTPSEDPGRFSISREWCASKAKTEDGAEIGAGLIGNSPDLDVEGLVKRLRDKCECGCRYRCPGQCFSCKVADVLEKTKVQCDNFAWWWADAIKGMEEIGAERDKLKEEVERLEGALKRLADQPTLAELEAEYGEPAGDAEEGYNGLIEIARTALKGGR